MVKKAVLKSFTDSDNLAEMLANYLAEKLSIKLQGNKFVNLVLPGGNTPKKLLEALSKKVIHWDRINIFSCDERCIPKSYNERHDVIIENNLITNAANRANFFPILNNDGIFERSISQIASYEKNFNNHPYITILGVGDDGHVASIFKDDKNDSSHRDDKKTLHLVDSISHCEKRVTLTLNKLLKSDEIIVISSGLRKFDAIGDAFKFHEHGESIIGEIIKEYTGTTSIYWSQEI